MEPQTRQPTLEEAVDWIMRSRTEEYRALCLIHWRNLYGDDYADQIERRLESRKRK